jgi:hypothetical protein
MVNEVLRTQRSWKFSCNGRRQNSNNNDNDDDNNNNNNVGERGRWRGYNLLLGDILRE